MRRRERIALARVRFAKPGHRSHVSGAPRLISGRRKSRIEDALHANADSMMERLRRRHERQMCQCGHHAGSHDLTVGYCRAQRAHRNPCGCRRFVAKGE